MAEKVLIGIAATKPLFLIWLQCQSRSSVLISGYNLASFRERDLKKFENRRLPCCLVADEGLVSLTNFC